jgi:hypothetical protein
MRARARARTSPPFGLVIPHRTPHGGAQRYAATAVTLPARWRRRHSVLAGGGVGAASRAGRGRSLARQQARVAARQAWGHGAHGK